jgi:hypothetical protein
MANEDEKSGVDVMAIEMVRAGRGEWVFSQNCQSHII